MSNSGASSSSNLGVLQQVIEQDPTPDDPYGMQRVSVDRCVWGVGGGERIIRHVQDNLQLLYEVSSLIRCCSRLC